MFDRLNTTRAFDAQPTWEKLTAEQRSDALDLIDTEILARREEWGHLRSREEGKTLAEGVGEVARAGRVFKCYGSREQGSNAREFYTGVKTAYTLA